MSSVDLTLVSDYDEPRRRVRLRAAAPKTRKPLWVELPDVPRTSIAKACRAAGIPLFSPHDLRHRRISLLHLRGMPWARIAEFVGQRDLTVTANTYTYTHVLVDEAEVDYSKLLM